MIFTPEGLRRDSRSAAVTAGNGIGSSIVRRPVAIVWLAAGGKYFGCFRHYKRTLGTFFTTETQRRGAN
jgi:hypothetical protein